MVVSKDVNARTAADRQTLFGLERTLGYSFRDRSLLELALTHRSSPPPVINATQKGDEELPPVPWHNERLEFLGDAVLSLLISSLLFRRFPQASEGELSHWRSALVNTRSLCEIAQTLVLGSALRLGRGEALSGGREKASILAGGFEATLGAVYLDGGPDAACALVRQLFLPRIALIRPGRLGKDFKSLLQERLQSMGYPLPTYEVSHMSGAPHEREFVITCRVEELCSGQGSGLSKRKAEQAAAEAVLTTMSSLQSGTALRPADDATEES